MAMVKVVVILAAAFFVAAPSENQVSAVISAEDPETELKMVTLVSWLPLKS